MTALRIIAFILAAASVGVALWTRFRLLREYKAKCLEATLLKSENRRYIKTLTVSGFDWRYGEDEKEHYFDVYGLTFNGLKAAKRFYYNPDDPEEREYMEREAQELVEHLNYEP